MTTMAAKTVAASSAAVPPWLCIPFAGLLLCIAICPLIKPEWWDKNKGKAVLLWSLLFIIPFAIVGGLGKMADTVLGCVFNDYLTFIVLLFGLFCVAGNIKLEGSLVGSPKANVVLLLIGTLLSSFIGTTGSSMLMVRPVIKVNSWRKRKYHIMVFFIFLISNMGGCLTPIGDPPLLMGFMRGVPFMWSMHLLPVLLFNLVILLPVFYLIDRHAYKKDLAEGVQLPEKQESKGAKMRIRGLHNILFLVMIVVAVVLSGVLQGVPGFKDAAGNLRGLPITPNVTLSFPSIIEVAIILLAAWLSFHTTKQEIRTENHFTWDAIKEVATLFIGIFITMQPALMLLKVNGAQLGLSQPAQMFWASGALSSFLDNTPTYLVFLTTAGSLHFASGLVTTVGTIPAKMLLAISCGAVFMGANTYIGNAPNFMVKSISEENGIKMPSFFGYMLWSVAILIPVFLLDMLVFFL
jgi:Na+/H+ antiporter NhaD/arsenite permease-like protein